MMPCTETARLTVKNTFLNWQEDDEDDCRADAFSSRRAFKTCHDLHGVITEHPEQEVFEPVVEPTQFVEVLEKVAEQCHAATKIAGVVRPLRRRGRGGVACREAKNRIQQWQSHSGEGIAHAEEKIVVSCVKQAIFEKEPQSSQEASGVNAHGSHGRLNIKEWPSLLEAAQVKVPSPGHATEESELLEIASATNAARIAPEHTSGITKAAELQQHRLHFQNRVWCHLYLHPDMLRPGFDLNKKIIGRGGCCTRGIYDATGAKIRLRGRGSGHLEGGQEAPAPLMLAITGEKGKAANFCKAIQMAAELLRDVSKRFQSFCDQRNKQQRGKQQQGASQPPTRPSGPFFWVGEISACGARCAANILDELSLSLPDAKQRSTRPTTR